jgi:hypothetical protein
MNIQLARNNLLNAVRLVVAYTKTYDYYSRTIEGYVRDLYRGDIEEGDFVTQMSELIDAQLTRAWHEGMRENELDPVEDMEPEWQSMLDEIILSEYDYVDNFAADIVAARDEQLDWEPLLSRAELWANRYNDVYNTSVVTTGNQKLIWILGATEEHCDNCAALNGIVAWAEEWEESGVVPQNPPNMYLSCEGWRCDCQLIPTTARHTRNALDAIQQALSGSKSLKGWVTINGNHVLIGEEGDEGGGGGGGTSGDRVRSIENDSGVYGSEIEHVYAVDDNGDVLFHNSGGTNSVEFSDSDIEKMNDAVMTHNHPSGNTFSEDDIELSTIANVREVRATGEDGTYIMTRPTNGWGNYSELYGKAEGLGLDNWMDSDRKSGTLEYIWKEYAKLSGANYRFVPRSK